MNDSERKLITLLRYSLRREICTELSEPHGDEADELYKESIMQSVPVLAYSALPKLSCEFYSKLEAAVFQTAASNCRVIYEHNVIGKMLSDNNIPYCILKGWASASYYPQPEKRSMGDVDFLVRPEDIERTGRALEALGYKKENHAEEHAFHIGYIKGNKCAELHYSISTATESDFDVSRLTDDIIKTAVPSKTPYGEINIPSPYYHAVIMLFHVYRHYLNLGIGLRHLCDWAVFAASSDYDLICERLAASAKEWGLYKFSQMLSQVSSIYLGIPWKSSFGEKDEALCQAFIDEILQTGNFGRKNNTLSELFAENKLKRSNSVLLSLLKSTKKAVCGHWPSAEKNPIVLACGFIIFPTIYIFRSIMGKRPPLHLIRDYNNAKKQANTHKGLSDGKHDINS